MEVILEGFDGNLQARGTTGTTVGVYQQAEAGRRVVLYLPSPVGLRQYVFFSS